MGYTGYYLNQIDKNWTTSPKRREYLDLFLATTIAYGNMGWLVTEFDPVGAFRVEALARSYYMMQQLQQQYAFSEPKVIEYADRNGKFLTPSQALATGAHGGGPPARGVRKRNRGLGEPRVRRDLDGQRSVRHDARVAGFRMAGV